MGNKAIALASAVFLAACAPQEATQTAEGPPFDAEAFSAGVDQFVSAWNAGETDALGAMIAEDAVLMQPDGAPLAGRAAILATISEGYDIEMLQQSATVDEAFMIGDHAYARGTWMLQPTAAAGDDVPSMNGKWSAVYRSAPDGGWQIWRWMWNQPPGQVGYPTE